MISSESNKANHHGVIQSSIGMLRERFKELERVKEMRENKELLRMFSSYKNTNGTTTTCTISPIILNPTNNNNNTNSSTITSDVNVFNININFEDNIKNNSDYSTMQVSDEVEEELQIFIPPNYMSNKSRKVSCYSSPSSNNSTTSTLSSSHNNNNSAKIISLNDVSLSLWPHNNSLANEHFRRENSEEKLSKMSTLRPVSKKRTSSCLSSACKLEESHQTSDVDTTLHL